MTGEAGVGGGGWVGGRNISRASARASRCLPTLVESLSPMGSPPSVWAPMTPGPDTSKIPGGEYAVISQPKGAPGVALHGGDVCNERAGGGSSARETDVRRLKYVAWGSHLAAHVDGPHPVISDTCMYSRIGGRVGLAQQHACGLVQRTLTWRIAACDLHVCRVS